MSSDSHPSLHPEALNETRAEQLISAFTAPDAYTERCLAEYKTLPASQRREVVKGVFETAATAAADRLSYFFLRDITDDVWNAWVAWQNDLGIKTILPVLNEALTDKEISDDLEYPLGQALAVHHPGVLSRVLNALEQASLGEDQHCVARSLLRYLAADARPTGHYLAKKKYFNEYTPEQLIVLKKADAWFLRSLGMMVERLEDHLQSFSVELTDAFSEALLSPSTSILSVTARYLIEAHRQAERVGMDASKREDRLLNACKIEPSHILVVLPYLMERRLNAYANGGEFNPSDKDERVIVIMLTQLRNESILRGLDDARLIDQLQRFISLAEQAPPRSFRLELANILYQDAGALSPLHSIERIEAYKQMLERLKQLPYQRIRSEGIEKDTADIQGIIQGFIDRLNRLLEFKKGA